MPRASDVSYHSQWAHGFVEALSEGIPFPRWVGTTNRGFGAPVFLIYPPLSYYLVAACSLATSSVVEAMRLALIVAAFLSGLSFFLAARGMGSELGAAFGAALYVLLPYHALDLYERFALAEYTAFVWFPLLFWAVRVLADRLSWGAWFGLAACLSGLFLTHPMSAYLIGFSLGPYALLRLGRSRRWSHWIPMAAAAVVAVLCCAVYLLPLFVHRSNVHLDWFDTPHYDWRRNFIYRDEVAFGYRFDVVKPWSTAASTTQGVFAVAAAGVLAARLRGARRSAARDSGAALESPDRELRLEGWTQFGLSLWSWYLQTPLSTPLWAVVPQLGAAQFPWRFSAFQLLGACFLAHCVLARGAPPTSESEQSARREDRRLGILDRLAWPLRRRPLLAAAVLALAALPALRVSAQLTGSRPWDFDEAMARNPVYRYRVVKEFFPRGVENWLQWESVPFPERRAFLRQPGRIEELSWTAHARRVSVETPRSNRLILMTFVYPGWQARLDGRTVPILSDNPMNAIEVEVPAGAHEVEVVFMPTWDRRLGAAVSGISVLLVLLLGLWKRLNPRRGSGAARPFATPAGTTASSR
jgi:hypothetical protein